MSLLDSSEPTARQGFFVSFPAIPLVRSVILSPLCVIQTIPLCKNQKIVSMSVANSRSEGSRILPLSVILSGAKDLGNVKK